MPWYEFHEEEDNQIKGIAKCRRQLFVGTTKARSTSEFVAVV